MENKNRTRSQNGNDKKAQVVASKQDKKLSNQDSSAENTQFFLTEYQESLKLWMHTDARIGAGINFYLTILAALFPGVILLYGAIKDINLFILLLLPAGVFLFATGIFLIGEITATDMLKAEYMFSVNLARRYFADRDPKVLEYIFYPPAVPSLSPEPKFAQLHPDYHRPFVLVINIVNAFLAGGVVSGLLWLVIRTTVQLTIIILIGSGVSLFTLILLTSLYEVLKQSWVKRKLASFVIKYSKVKQR